MLFAAGLLVAHDAAAQSGPLHVGDRLRFRRADGAATRRPWCMGRLTAHAGDTLVLIDAGRCLRGTVPAGAVADLSVARGDRGPRSTHAFLGFLGGAAAGGLLARLAAGDGCRVPGCGPDGGYAVAILTTLGVGAGAVVGGVVGLALPAGPRWVPVGPARPVRVAGLALRPGLRLARGGPRT
jgi:hypothetical protein